MDGSIELSDIDDFISTSKLLKTHGKKLMFENHDENIKQLTTTSKANVQYILDNNVNEDIVESLTFHTILANYMVLNDVNVENVEMLLQKFMTKTHQKWVMNDHHLIRGTLFLYHETKSPTVRDFIVYLIKNEYIDGQGVILYYRDSTATWASWDEFKDIVSQLNQSEFNNFVSQYFGMTTQLKKLYKEAIAGKVVDTAMGLRNSGLPSIAVENIASHAYDTTGFNLYQLMSMVRPVTEGGRPGVMGAGQTEYDEQEYIDL